MSLIKDMLSSSHASLLAAGLALSNEVNISDERLFETFLSYGSTLRVNLGAASWRLRHLSFPKAHTIDALDHGQPHSKPSRHMPMHQEQKRRLAMELSKLGTLQAAIRQCGSVGRCCNATGLTVADAVPVPL
jgi:hypothetical protein